MQAGFKEKGEMTDGQRYFNKPQGVPRRVPAGRVLAHNNAQHATWTGARHQLRLLDMAKGKCHAFQRCKCGWKAYRTSRQGRLALASSSAINSGVSG
jgi:hypothetical protein